MCKLSVIVPVYNALNDVKLCLKSLKHNFNFELGEIIIVNDCSNLKTSNFLRKFVQSNTQFNLIENQENLGFVKTCNKGMKISNGNIVVLLNSDTVIPPHFVEKIIECFNSKNKIGIASPISSFSNAYFIPCKRYSDIGKINNLLEQKHKCAYPLILTAEGFCYCIRRQVIEQQGYLDEIWGKGYHEETDYSLRAIKNGWENALIDNLYVYHRRNASFGENREIQIKKNNPEFYRRWGDFRQKYKAEHNLINPIIEIEKEIYPNGNPASSKCSLLEKFFRYIQK